MVESQHDVDVGVVEQILGTRVVADAIGHVEIARLNEAGGQIAAGLAVVEIVQGRANVFHVGRDGVADDEHLKARNHENHDSHPRVSEDLDEFLDQHVFQAFKHYSC